MKRLWSKQDTKNCKKNSDFEFCLLEWMGGNGSVFKRNKRETRQWPKCPCWCPTCGPRGPHVDRGTLSTCGSRGSHVATMQWPFGHSCLTRTLRVLRPFSSLRTPISNPSSDYESWLPYARQQLRNFTKMLRNHLGKQCRKWLNDWKCKVA